ncbi:MAG TPA: efflux RND transporter periplasmic adaptor subunit [Thermoanaerobaculia bacterium]|nr:efflux RND transporter periplasmic adaptor subunit [Thermoanaerobaculia bacterium]
MREPSVQVRVRPCSSVFFLAALLLACHHERKTAAPPPRPVQVQAAAAPAREESIRYSANIAAETQVNVAFKAGGYVRGILQSRAADGRMRDAQEGDPVRRGAVLAHIDPAEARERLGQARAQLAEAEAGLEKARLDLGRATRLFAAQSLTKPDLDAATAAARASEARAAGARATVQLAESGLRDTDLKAPLDGVVISRKVEVGSLAAPGVVGFVLADVRSVKAVFGVPDSVVARLHKGDTLALRTDALGAETFRGRVTAVSPAADPQARVFGVEVEVANRDGHLRPGMIATVEVPPPAAGPGPGPAAPTIPLTAVVRSEKSPSGYAVFVVEGEGETQVVHARGVTLGEVFGNDIAVKDGLRLGERVVVTGATLLADGERVRVAH